VVFRVLPQSLGGKVSPNLDFLRIWVVGRDEFKMNVAVMTIDSSMNVRSLGRYKKLHDPPACFAPGEA
jgi:hypothetical protein